MPVSFGGQSQQRWGDNTANQGDYIRDLFLADLKGLMQGTMPARKKGMLVLAFFRADDPTCARVLSLLQKLADAYKESGKLSVMAVSQSEPGATAAFTGALGLTFPVVLDRDNYHSMLYGVGTIPVVYLTDSNGKVLLKTTGYRPLVLNDLSAKYAAFAEVEAVPLVEDVPTTPAAALLFAEETAPPAGALPSAAISGESATLVTRPAEESPTLVTKGEEPKAEAGESPTLVPKSDAKPDESPTLVTKKDG